MATLKCVFKHGWKSLVDIIQDHLEEKNMETNRFFSLLSLITRGYQGMDQEWSSQKKLR